MTATELERFVHAQKQVYECVIEELQAGQKKSHWMWFIFPQIKGLGQSEIAKRYAISSMDEAKAYLDHPVLGSRLEQCAQLVLAIQDKSLSEIFGYPDDMKFRSCMTMFARVADESCIFQMCLNKYCDNRPAPHTNVMRSE